MNFASSVRQSGALQTPVSNFDGLARLYRWMELFTFGSYLARCRSTFLSDCASCRQALVLGDGDGRFTAQLLRANPAIEIDAVDASPAMLAALLRRAASHRARVAVFCADIRGWQPPNPPYDLVVTHFLLDCLTTEDVQSLAVTLRGKLTDRALWIVSEFAVADGWFGRLIAAPVVAILYRVFGVLTGLSIRTLPAHAAALSQAGFTLARRQKRLGGLLISELWTPKW